nr:proline-rich receptor-like protein kinase PERK2 [Aegilops tauschii subsp. strangulata]
MTSTRRDKSIAAYNQELNQHIRRQENQMCASMIDLEKVMTRNMELEEELKSTRSGYEEEIGHETAAPDVHVAALVGSVVALAGSVARHLALPSPSPSTDLLASEDTAPIADPVVPRPRTATTLPRPPLDAVAPEPAAMPLPLPCERLPLLLSPPTAPSPRPSALSRPPVVEPLARARPHPSLAAPSAPPCSPCPASPRAREAATPSSAAAAASPCPPASPFTASARNSQRRPGPPAPWSPAPRSAQIGCAPRASAHSGCAR